MTKKKTGILVVLFLIGAVFLMGFAAPTQSSRDCNMTPSQNCEKRCDMTSQKACVQKQANCQMKCLL